MFKAHRLLHHSTLGARVMKKKKRNKEVQVEMRPVVPGFLRCREFGTKQISGFNCKPGPDSGPDCLIYTELNLDRRLFAHHAREPDDI